MKRKVLSTVLAAIFIPSALHAAIITLDWNQVTWTPGQLKQFFDIDPSNPGFDLSIEISGNTNRITQPVSATTLITGGVSPTNKTLQLVSDFAANTESLTVRIAFYYLVGIQGVRSVNLSILDIDGDGNSWREEVRGVGTLEPIPLPSELPLPGVLQPVSQNPSFQITELSQTTLLTATSVSDDNSNNGTVNVSFGAQARPTNSVVFTFGASTSGTFNPIESGIALGNISYNSVPEPTSGVLLFSSIFAVMRFRQRENSPARR